MVPEQRDSGNGFPVSPPSAFLSSPRRGHRPPIGVNDEGVWLHHPPAVGAGDFDVQSGPGNLRPDATEGTAKGVGVAERRAPRGDEGRAEGEVLEGEGVDTAVASRNKDSRAAQSPRCPELIRAPKCPHSGLTDPRQGPAVSWGLDTRRGSRLPAHLAIGRPRSRRHVEASAYPKAGRGEPPAPPNPPLCPNPACLSGTSGRPSSPRVRAASSRRGRRTPG